MCPVGINLHELLLYNRSKAVMENDNSRSERMGWLVWKKACLSRSLMNIANGRLKNLVIKTLFRKSWGDNRSLPEFADKSFNQMWKESEN